jgi:hypothetical protein
MILSILCLYKIPRKTYLFQSIPYVVNKIIFASFQLLHSVIIYLMLKIQVTNLAYLVFFHGGWDGTRGPTCTCSASTLPLNYTPVPRAVFLID